MIQNNIIAKALLATGFYSNRKTKKKYFLDNLRNVRFYLKRLQPNSPAFNGRTVR